MLQIVCDVGMLNFIYIKYISQRKFLKLLLNNTKHINRNFKICKQTKCWNYNKSHSRNLPKDEYLYTQNI